MTKYEVPENLGIEQKVYSKWLSQKADSLRKRNKKKDGLKCGSTGEYKGAIHKAVMKSVGVDFYIGEKLDWSLLCKYNSEDARKGGVEYMKKFAKLPTVDHYFGARSCISTFLSLPLI